MSKDDKHIYKVPRPIRSHSLNIHRPSPPLPIRNPHSQHHTHHTVYTQNQLYSLNLQRIPNSAPPSLPPCHRTGDSDSLFSHPLPIQTMDMAQEEQISTASGSSPKTRWGNTFKTIPHFGSFKEKSKKSSQQGRVAQIMRRQSSDEVALSYNSQPSPGSNLTLGQLAENHAHSFPLQVRVLQSYSFQASQLNIIESDVYNLLLVKQQQFVSMKDRLGTSYAIPLNSAVQFGYINSTDRQSSTQSLTYKSYTRVADLLCLSDHQIPRVMCAQESHKGQNGKCSVEVGEILLVLRIQKNKLSGRKYLKVYSFTEKSKKQLYNDCMGNFTTNPAHLRLWLTDIVSHSTSILPCQAVIYLEKRFTSALKSFPATLLQSDSFVTLTEIHNQTSIIATLVPPQPPTPSSHSAQLYYSTQPLYQPTHLDIPLSGLLSNLQVEIQIPHDSDTLHSTARKVYEGGWNISFLKSLDDGINDRAYNTKSLFYSILRKGYEQEGVNLLIPSSAYRDIPPERLITPSNTIMASTDLEHDPDSDIEHYEKISDWVTPELQNTAPSLPTPQVCETPSLSSQSSGFHSLPTPIKLSNNLPLPHTTSPILLQPDTHADDEYEQMDAPEHISEHLMNVPTNDDYECDVSDLHTAVKMLEDRIIPLEQRVAEHHHLQGVVRALSARIAKLEKQLMPRSHQQTKTAKNHSTSLKTVNIAYLCSLNPSQVISL